MKARGKGFLPSRSDTHSQTTNHRKDPWFNRSKDVPGNICVVTKRANSLVKTFKAVNKSSISIAWRFGIFLCYTCSQLPVPVPFYDTCMKFNGECRIPDC